jgi:AcrR family transcriptional regulator
MGRKRTIDRDALLDVAEAIVAEQGAGRLTFDEIAKRAGVSKGGVLYCFASKQELVAAMTRRDLDRFAAEVAAHRAQAGEGTSAGMRAHLAATRHESHALAARAASLMATLAETPEHAGLLRDYYRELLARLGGDGRSRVALFAAEGAFLLRGLGLVDFSEAEWNALFADIEGQIARPAGTESKS